MLKLNFAKKFDSMAIIICDAFKVELDRKFRNFNYEIDYSKYETFKVDALKHGKDVAVKKKIFHMKNTKIYTTRTALRV